MLEYGQRPRLVVLAGQLCGGFAFAAGVCPLERLGDPAMDAGAATWA